MAKGDITVELSSGGQNVKMSGDEFTEAVNRIGRDALRWVSEEKQLLPCKLSDAELIVRGLELAELVNDIATEEEAQASQRKAMKDRLTKMGNRLDHLAYVVQRKCEEREVSVVGELVDMAGEPMVRLTRTDTGEMLSLRPPRAQEIQPGLGG